jgi:integrase
LHRSTPAAAFTKEMGRGFLDMLEEKDDVSPRTYNNYLSFLITLWDWMADRRFVIDNIYRDFRRKPRRLMQKKRRLLSPDELGRLFAFLERENPQFLAVVVLCYCCFIRPKEIALLKCGDIDLRTGLVRVRAETAKNDNESYRTIPDEARPYLERLDLTRPDWYLFGKNAGRSDDFGPGRQPVNNKKFSDYWKTAVRPACHFGLDVQLYSLKDTGITGMLQSGVAINLVQQQADHSSVAMTAIYVGKSQAANAELRNANILPGKK